MRSRLAEHQGLCRRAWLWVPRSLSNKHELVSRGILFKHANSTALSCSDRVHSITPLLHGLLENKWSHEHESHEVQVSILELVVSRLDNKCLLEWAKIIHSGCLPVN